MVRKCFVAVLAALCCTAATAQQALWSAPGVVSPEMLSDGRVIFRIEAPEAQRVEVSGDFLASGTTFASLARDKDGVWTYTTPAPLAPELYTYTVSVDGFRSLDPNNVYSIRDVASVMNFFLVDGGRADLYGVNDVPHGTVSRVWYPSPTFGGPRRMTVYTPPGYGESDRTYPVLYLLHGMGGDEEAWLALGRAAQILDNLIAQGKAQPMVVVMPNGNLAQEAAPGESSGMLVKPTPMLPHTMDGTMETHFPEVVDFVDRHFRTLPRKASRAIAGLSMGGFHALHISKQYPDLFDYVGLFSAAILPRDGAESPVYADFDAKLEAQFRCPPRLYWIAVGADDFLCEANAGFRRRLDTAGYPYTYYESVGGHEWRNWRIYLSEFVPLLFRY